MEDPAEALQTAENALRLAVRQVIGDDWENKIADLDNLRAKQDEERKRRDGVLASDDLLNFTEFHQLTRLILSTWDAFKPVFDDKRRTETWFSVLEDVRNAIAHSRALVDYERHLVVGVSGQLRNQITMYRTSESPRRQHYPIIESVRDNFGRIAYVEGEYLDMSVRGTMPETPRLEIGDTVTLECIGSDARGRDLEWLVEPVPSGHFRAEALRAVGSPVRVPIVIGEEHVTEQLNVKIYLRALGARYTIHGRPREEGSISPAHDDERLLYFAVNPPIE
jgi:hypothetical protein